MARKRAVAPARRKPNTGTIREKPGRPLAWEAAFPIGHGEYRYDSFSTRSEAAEYLDRLTAERDHADTPRNVAVGSQLVRTFTPRWLELRREKIAPKTLENYTYLLELAIGQIGRYRMDEVTNLHADEMLMYFYHQGFQNIQQMKDVCRQVFKYAKKQKYINDNPFEDLELPTVERRHGMAITEAQRAHLLECAATEDIPDQPLCPLWHLYSYLGFRRGEGIGTRWQDCKLDDLDRATITIRQQLTRVGKATVPTRTTKTKAPRTVPLPRNIAEMLIDLRAWQIKRCAANPGMPLPSYVFTNAAGEPLKVDAVRHRWSLLRARAGMPELLRIHDLRHTALTLLELAGVPGSVLQALAGHKTAAMAAHYTNHASVDDVRRALK